MCDNYAKLCVLYLQYICEGYPAVSDINKSALTHTSCGYTPGTNLTCLLQSVASGNRSSDAVQLSTSLACAGRFNLLNRLS